MNDTFDLRISESHIEVHKFHGGTILLCVIFALVLQAFLPVYITKASILDLPLLITIYFGLSRRNPSTGLLLGTFIGLLQDSLSKTPIGLFGKDSCASQCAQHTIQRTRMRADGLRQFVGAFRAVFE